MPVKKKVWKLIEFTTYVFLVVHKDTAEYTTPDDLGLIGIMEYSILLRFPEMELTQDNLFF